MKHKTEKVDRGGGVGEGRGEYLPTALPIPAPRGPVVASIPGVLC